MAATSTGRKPKCFWMLFCFLFCCTWSCGDFESVWSLSCLISTWVSRTSSQLVFRTAAAHPMAGNWEALKWLKTHWAKGPFPVKPDLASSVSRLRGFIAACLTRFTHIGPGEPARGKFSAADTLPPCEPSTAPQNANDAEGAGLAVGAPLDVDVSPR